MAVYNLNSADLPMFPWAIFMLLLLAMPFVIVCMAPPPPAKRKRTVLSLQQKLELIKKLESGWTVTRAADFYGIGKQTVADIRKSKEKLAKFSGTYNIEAKARSTEGSRKTMKVASDDRLENATYKWLVQQRSVGVMVRGVEIRDAAEKFARHLDMPDFKASEGWLARFKNRHGLTNKRVYGETLDADMTRIEPFRVKLLKLIDDEGLLYSQVYNADETGLYFRALPRNTIAVGREATTPGRKISKDRLSVLCCANADGLHRLKPLVVGKARKPRALAHCMDALPCLYDNSKKAWFTRRIFKDWFFNDFIPAVRQYQTEVIGVAADRVRAVLLLDNAPAHPDEKELVSDDGQIRCMMLPPNTTSVIQPMDQGVICSAKRIYRRRFLEEVLVVFDEDQDVEEDTRGKQTLAKLKAYNIKSAIFNWTRAWNEVKATTLANGWKKLLTGEEVIPDFEGFEGYQATLRRAGEDLSADEIITWLETDEGDPGFELMTDGEIADSVQPNQAADDDDDDDDEDPVAVVRPRLSAVRGAMDLVLDFMDLSDDPNVQLRYRQARELRDFFIGLQHQGATLQQSKISSFFRPRSALGRPVTPSPTPVPSTSFAASPTPVPSTSYASSPTPSPSPSAARSSPLVFTSPSPSYTPIPMGDLISDYESDD